MKNKVIKARIIASAFTLMLTSCGISGNDVDLVKNGVLDIDKSRTVGQVLDGWEACKTTKWQSFKSQKGRTIVEFNCSSKLDGIEKIKKRQLGKPKKSLEVSSINRSFQFTINQDEAFEVSYSGLQVAWEDGTKYIHKPTKTLKAVLEKLEEVYNNKKSILGNDFWKEHEILDMWYKHAKR